MLNKENLESLMAMLDHFGQTYAVTIDPWDDIPLVSTDYREIRHWILSYDYDRVDLCTPHGIYSIQEDNNSMIRITLFVDHRQVFSEVGNYADAGMMCVLAYRWLRH